jgi:hypothetical protein
MPAPSFLPGLKAVYLAALLIIILLVAPSFSTQYIYFQF